MNEANAAQEAAIKHRDGPALVIAGPGSGKTFVITRRLDYLINNCHIKPSSILTITYTNAAAKEMKKRAWNFLGNSAYGLNFGTFHSIFYSVLKNRFAMSASNILKNSDKFIILSDIAVRIGLDTADMKGIADELSSIISRNKNGIAARDGLSDTLREQLFTLYQDRLKEERLIDFDDMILKCLSLFKKEPETLEKWRDLYRYIQIDEFQDINNSQYELIKILAGDSGNIFAVGDDDQSIYGFRGASPGIMMRFLSDYPGADQYELNINYRCKRGIAEASESVIVMNTMRLAKHPEAFDKTGGRVNVAEFPDRMGEIKAIASLIDPASFGSYAVLTRTNELASYFADGLCRKGIPVIASSKGRSLYDGDIGKDVISYIRLALGAYERRDILRVMNKPLRYLSREAFAGEKARYEDALDFYKGRQGIFETAERFVSDIKLMGRMRPKAFMMYLKNVIGYEEYLKKEGRRTEELMLLCKEAERHGSLREWLDAVRTEEGQEGGEKNRAYTGNGVAVMTLHASKGLEFREVFIVDVNEGIIPYHRAKLKEELEEERRLFYVGMTRAIDALHLFYIKDSFGKAMSPSVFLV